MVYWCLAAHIAINEFKTDDMRPRNNGLFLLVALVVTVGMSPSMAQNAGQYTGPIIDMHMHGYTTLYSTTRPCNPEPCEHIPTQIQEISEQLPKTIEMMDKHNIVLGFLSSKEFDELIRWKEAYPNRFIISPSLNQPNLFSTSDIRKFYQEGIFQGLGELNTIYYGIPPNVPELDSFFNLAVEYDVPVLIHLLGFGAASEKFSIKAGHPELLEDVLRKYPKLRIYLENAGFPFIDETISLMYMYPLVYADLSTISWIIPRDTFYQYVEKLVDAGLGKRLMFGSDQMIWPEVIDLAVEAINSADFLTVDQKKDIFYNNASRFLKLTEEQIAMHHEN